ncbi:MAG: site-specific integrase, partial [Fimbriimonadaceae bacterium]
MDSLEPLIQRFLDHLGSNRSGHTVRSYASDLGQLSKLTNGQADFSMETLRRYLRLFGATPVTRARKLSSLRSFVKYLRS